MDTFKFRDIRVEKANAILRYKRIQKITTLFRFLELFVFGIILSRFFSVWFALSLNLSSEYFRRISVTLISPRFVFLIGNAIIIILFLNSYSKNSVSSPDFYDEYIAKCRNNNMQEKNILSLDSHRKYASCHDDDRRKIRRSQSDQNMTQVIMNVVHKNNGRKDLRRTMTEKYCNKKSTMRNNKLAIMTTTENNMHKEDEMSDEEFNRTVEEFIARQQRLLREELFNIIKV